MSDKNFVSKKFSGGLGWWVEESPLSVPLPVKINLFSKNELSKLQLLEMQAQFVSVRDKSCCCQNPNILSKNLKENLCRTYSIFAKIIIQCRIKKTDNLWT